MLTRYFCYLIRKCKAKVLEYSDYLVNEKLIKFKYLNKETIMKKIKTIEAVAAYKTLKALKTSSMSDDAAMRVWKNMKALRHVADTYDKDVEEAQESLKDDKFEEMQRKLQECQQLEQKHADEGYEYTKDDSAKFAEVNEYFFNQKQKTEKYFSDLADKEVEVAIEAVDEKELFKAAKDCGLKFADMESLEVVIG